MRALLHDSSYVVRYVLNFFFTEVDGGTIGRAKNSISFAEVHSLKCNELYQTLSYISKCLLFRVGGFKLQIIQNTLHFPVSHLLFHSFILYTITLCTSFAVTCSVRHVKRFSG